MDQGIVFMRYIGQAKLFGLFPPLYPNYPILGHPAPMLPHASVIRATPDLLDLHGDLAAELGGEVLCTASGLTESDKDSLCLCHARHVGPSPGPVKSTLEYILTTTVVSSIPAAITPVPLPLRNLRSGRCTMQRLPRRPRGRARHIRAHVPVVRC